MFTAFLGTLNYGMSPDHVTISGCFAGHCDWRLPTIIELETLLLAPYPCGTDPCRDSIFGPVPIRLDGYEDYWSSTSDAPPYSPADAYTIDFSDGSFFSGGKDNSWYARAVRGGN